MKPKDTLFLKIISGEIPSHKIYEDEHTYAFLSISPNTRGHALVIPKEYAENIYDIKDTSLMSLISTVQKIAIVLKKALRADGINIAQNNEAPAGQAVFHLHFHIIPRYHGDGLTHWPELPITQEELATIAAEIRKTL